MPAKKSAVPPEVYQLKVTLLGTSPPIWRRLLAPADMTLAQLHDVLQTAMGWDDAHMHEFSVGQRRFGQPNPEDRLMGMPSVENERTVRLSDILARVGSKAIYTYDFGDSWEHAIVLEKRLPSDPSITVPVCTDGKGSRINKLDNLHDFGYRKVDEHVRSVCPAALCVQIIVPSPLSSRVHRKIVEGFPDSTNLWRPSATPTTSSTKRRSSGSAMILIHRPFRPTRSTGGSHPCAAAAKLQEASVVSAK